MANGKKGNAEEIKPLTEEAKKAAEEKAKLEAEKEAAAEAEKARLEAEKEAAAEEKARLEAEKKATAEAEKAKLEAEKKAAADAEKARLEAENNDGSGELPIVGTDEEAEKRKNEERSAEEAREQKESGSEEEIAAEKEAFLAEHGKEVGKFSAHFKAYPTVNTFHFSQEKSGSLFAFKDLNAANRRQATKNASAKIITVKRYYLD